jgi:hypothetical protein
MFVLTDRKVLFGLNKTIIAAFYSISQLQSLADTRNPVRFYLPARLSSALLEARCRLDLTIITGFWRAFRARCALVFRASLHTHSLLISEKQ